MKKDLGVKPFVFPMPVLLISTYNDDGTVDVMNMAWGGICDYKMVALNIGSEHRTAHNIKKRGAFTLSIADLPHMAEADYFGIDSANDVPDKFERTGMHAVKSNKVDAPIVEEFPITFECTVVECQNQPYGLRVLGEIKSVLADESVLDGDTVDVKKLNAIIFDTFGYGYYSVGEKVGQAWGDGNKFVTKK